MVAKNYFAAGDVVEIEMDGESTTALVLLVSDAAAIFDPCDGSVPFVLPLDELPLVRVFTEALAA
jgi:hypothetical protein